MLKKHLLNILLLIFFVPFAFAGEDHIEIGIEEQLGKTIPLDVTFKDAEGNDVLLADIIDNTTVLAFVYYKCPGICSPLLFSLAEVVNKTDLDLGYDYKIVTISMNQFETPEDAAEKKRVFTEAIEKNFPEGSWKFLTGDSVSIRKVSDAAGFYFKREGKEFRHSGTFIFLDKNGKICRYLIPGYTNSKGFGILPFDFKMAVLEASEGKVTPTISRVLQFCFSYDPEGKGYVLNFTRIFGVIILLLVVVFLLLIKFKFKPKQAIIKTR